MSIDVKILILIDF